MAPADKIMFEIYREAGYDNRYCVVYFTELSEHNRDFEINKAMAGEHFFDGFINQLNDREGKAKIAEIIARLNEGESLSASDAARELKEIGALVS